MNGIASKQMEVIIWDTARNNNFIFDDSWTIFTWENIVVEIKQARVIPAARELHNKEIAWWPTPTWLKNEYIYLQKSELLNHKTTENLAGK